MRFAALLLGAYLLGSVPFGLLIAAGHGIDLRKVGSGNIGSTNLSRALGRKMGLCMLCAGLGKGAFTDVGGGRMAWRHLAGTKGLLARLAVGCAAVIGHIFPVYLRFKGGKGVATSFGVAIGLWPYYTLCAAGAMLVWIIFVLIWRYVSLASLAAAVAFPVILRPSIALRPAGDFRNCGLC